MDTNLNLAMRLCGVQTNGEGLDLHGLSVGCRQEGLSLLGLTVGNPWTNPLQDNQDESLQIRTCGVQADGEGAPLMFVAHCPQNVSNVFVRVPVIPEVTARCCILMGRSHMSAGSIRGTLLVNVDLRM